MPRIGLGSIVAFLLLASAVTMAQSSPPAASATIVSAEEIAAVVNTPGGGDREIKIVDMGRYNLGVAVLRRGAMKPGGRISAINHIKVTEVYQVVSGEGTLVTGGEVVDIKPLAADNELVTTVVGPGNNATFTKPVMSRRIKTGDIVIIPAGVYHGFSEIADHIDIRVGAARSGQGAARRLCESGLAQVIANANRPTVCGRRARFAALVSAPLIERRADDTIRMSCRSWSRLPGSPLNRFPDIVSSALGGPGALPSSRRARASRSGGARTCHE